MNNKIAIISEYYKSSNYGGNLQAYALVRFLNNNGFFAEQTAIVYKKINSENHKTSRLKKNS